MSRIGQELGDRLAPGLTVVFVGFNPSLLAWRTGHYYANPGNQFYRLLHVSGLTPRRLRPEEDVELPHYGIGLTDLLPGVPSATAGELPAGRFRTAAPALLTKIEQHRPHVVCFNGLGVFQHVFGYRPSVIGMQPSQRLGASLVAVTPSTSGLANGREADRLAAFHAVADCVKRATPHASS